MTIDFTGLEDRIVALPVPARNYARLVAGKAGCPLSPRNASPIPIRLSRVVVRLPSPQTLYRFDLAAKKTDKIVEGIRDFDLSFDGEKMLYKQGEKWTVSPAGVPPKPDEGELKLDSLEVRVEPAGGVEADVPGGMACRTRFLL